MCFNLIHNLPLYPLLHHTNSDFPFKRFLLFSEVSSPDFIEFLGFFFTSPQAKLQSIPARASPPYCSSSKRNDASKGQSQASHRVPVCPPKETHPSLSNRLFQYLFTPITTKVHSTSLSIMLSAFPASRILLSSVTGHCPLD